MEFRGLSRVKNCRGNFPGPIKRLNKYDFYGNHFALLNGRIALARERQGKLERTLRGKFCVFYHPYLRLLVRVDRPPENANNQGGIGAFALVFCPRSAASRPRFPCKFVRVLHISRPVATTLRRFCNSANSIYSVILQHR